MIVLKSMNSGRVFSATGCIRTTPATIKGPAWLYLPGEVSIHIRNKVHYHISEAVEHSD